MQSPFEGTGDLRGRVTDIESNTMARDDVAALLADTDFGYAAGSGEVVAAGDYIRTRKEGFSYKVADSAATGADIVCASGDVYEFVKATSGYWVQV